jgi:flagellin
MAEEMVDYVKNVILSRSSVAMLAQANLKSQHILQLLGG